MKLKIAIATAQALACLLTGCGGGGEKPNTTATAPSPSPAPAPAPSPAPSPSPAPTPAPAPSPAPDEWPPAVSLSPTTACSTALTGTHQTYHVGPGQTYTELTNIPWLSLQAGDVVNIHYRSTPYRTKFGLKGQGTASAPIVINGVTDSNCNRPEINGQNAVTATDSRNATFSPFIQSSSLIGIDRGPNDDYSTYVPKFITIQNLKIAGAHASTTFTNNSGATTQYDTFSAAIYATRVRNLTVQNCEITGNGLGVFTNTRGQTAEDYSANVIIRNNKIHLNGNTGRQTEHNLYVQARRALYEGNEIGQSISGSSLKDRSSGTVIRYNKIIASARALDLVETEEETFSTLHDDPLYNHAWVYGNIIINDYQQPHGFAVGLIHWGYDNDIARARTGTLFYYGNTLVNNVPQNQFWYISPFQIGTDGLAAATTNVESSDNIFWQQSNTEWRFLSHPVGYLTFRGTNYLPTGWNETIPGGDADVRTSGSTNIEGLSPLLDATTFTPAANSPALNKGHAGPSFTPSGATAANLAVTHQYQAGIGIVAKPTNGLKDIGAVERP